MPMKFFRALPGFSKKSFPKDILPLRIARDQIPLLVADDARQIVAKQRERYFKERQDILDGLVQADRVKAALAELLQYICVHVQQCALERKCEAEFRMGDDGFDRKFLFSGRFTSLTLRSVNLEKFIVIQGRIDFLVLRHITDLLIDELEKKRCFEVQAAYRPEQTYIDSKTREPCEALSELKLRW